MHKIISILIAIFLFPNCHSYEVKLNPKFKESEIVKLRVPIRQNRASGFHDEEDLSYLCSPNEMVQMNFRANAPYEVWCRK